MSEIAERRYTEALADMREHVERKRGDLAKAEALLASMERDKPRWLNFYNMPRGMFGTRDDEVTQPAR